VSRIKNGNNGRPVNVKISKLIIIAMIVLVLAAVILFTWFDPAREWELFQKYVVKDSESIKDENSYAQCAPVDVREITVELDNGSITLIGLIPEKERTHLTIRLRQVPGLRVFQGYEGALESDLLRDRLNDQLKQIYLRDESGREYRYREGSYSIEHTYTSAGSTGDSWFSDVYLELPPLVPGTALVILVVPLPENPEVTITIPLE